MHCVNRDTRICTGNWLACRLRVCLQSNFRMIGRFFVPASQAFECMTGFHGDHSHGAGRALGTRWCFNFRHLPVRFFRIQKHPKARVSNPRKPPQVVVPRMERTCRRFGLSRASGFGRLEKVARDRLNSRPGQMWKTTCTSHNYGAGSMAFRYCNAVDNMLASDIRSVGDPRGAQ